MVRAGWQQPIAWDAMRVVLRGIAQVMFQPHAGTGLLFVAGLAVGSPLVALGALLGSAIGTGRSKIRTGLNACLSASGGR